MFFVVIAAWLVGIIVSLVNHNRKLPLTTFGIGILILVGNFTIGFGSLAIALMAVLCVVIWIANKLDMS